MDRIEYDHPLYKAAENGNIELLERIVSTRSADIKRADSKLMYVAAKHGQTETVNYLIKQGLDVNCNNNKEINPLEIASLNGHIEIVKTLLKHGADVHAKDDYALAQAAGNGHIEIMKTLLEHGANVNANDGKALTFAVIGKQKDAVNLLIENGADVSINNNHAYDRALFSLDVDIIKTLITNGADIKHKNDQALRDAARTNKQDIVNLLVIDYNMPISQDTMDYLKKCNAQETIDTINKRDLNIKLNSNLKQKKEKSFTMKI